MSPEREAFEETSDTSRETLRAYTRALEALAFFDRLRQPDNLCGEDEARMIWLSLTLRLTALRPCLTAGLPLSCTIVVLEKNSAAPLIFRAAQQHLH
jgi:hypothetical protein